jgi:signal recognition particle subunit SRP68
MNRLTNPPTFISENSPVNKHLCKVFLLAKTAQNSYGIKNSDYERYRRYCAKKIEKLRKSMGIKYGTKTKFIKKDIIKEKQNDSKILQIALFNA